jgi:serine/threonine protein kinase
MTTEDVDVEIRDPLACGVTIKGERGEYTIVKRAGQGAVGVVYEATSSAGKTVAIKVLFPCDNLISPKKIQNVRTRFKREANNAIDLAHDNIIKVFDYGHYDDAFQKELRFLAMEFSPNSLQDRIRSSADIPLETAIDYISDISAALIYLHERTSPIFHRDVKPSNVLLDANDKVKLSDFGVAQWKDVRQDLTKETQSGVVLTGHEKLGTWDFMSPEQKKNPAKIDCRADLFSLGLTGIYLLTKKLPDDYAIARNMLELRPSEVYSCTPLLDGLLLKAIAYKKEMRFQSVSDFRSHLLDVKKELHSESSQDDALVPEGEFIFGLERKRTYLDSYYVDKYCVTNKQFATVFPSHNFKPGADLCPVVNVTFEEAIEYAKKVGKDLPTEEEWEKAARGLDGQEFSYGNVLDPSKANDYSNGRLDIPNVYSHPENISPFGCFSMCGDVAEWTKTQEGDMIVTKGLTWMTKDIRACARDTYNPSGGAPHLSFRCVRRHKKGRLLESLARSSDKLY